MYPTTNIKEHKKSAEALNTECTSDFDQTLATCNLQSTYSLKKWSYIVLVEKTVDLAKSTINLIRHFPKAHETSQERSQKARMSAVQHIGLSLFCLSFSRIRK